MRRLQGTKTMYGRLCALLLLTIGSMVGVAHAGKNTEALAADHIIACIRTALAAQPGLVREVEAEYKRGQWLCEVEIVDEAGQTFDVHVDVTKNQVVKAERD